jgi:hypothetical protein
VTKHFLSQLKTAQLFQNFGTINNTKFPGAVTKTITGVAILKSVPFALLHNLLGLLPINGHDCHKITVEIKFHLK